MAQKILLTGATGFLGSRITQQLLQRTQMQIIGTSKHKDIKEKSLRQALSTNPAAAESLARLKVVQCDLLTDPECFARLVLDEKPSFVIHTACPTLEPWGSSESEI